MLRTLAVIACMIASVGLVSACATLPDKIDKANTTIAAPKTQSDLRWGCLALQGAASAFTAFAPALKVDDTGMKAFAYAKTVISGACAKVAAGQVTDINGVYATIMDAAGWLSVELGKQQSGGS